MLLAHGCEAPLPEMPPSAAQPNAAQAFEAWRSIAATPPQDRDVERAVQLTSIMAAEPMGLAPLVALLGDTEVSGERKVFAIVCLTSQREALPAYEGQLIAWSAPEHPADTRKLAAHMLGLLESPTALAAAGKLLDDGDRVVREAAMGALLSFHPEMVSARLMAFWDDPETSAAIRNQVVLGMPPHLVASYLDIYASAAVDHRMSEPARLRAISVLGQLGEAKHIPVLEECIATAPEPVVQEHARGALALLRVSAGAETVAAE